MAKVLFYPAKIDFPKLVLLFNQWPEADFTYLVFQTEMEDSNRKIDEYVLAGYRVGANWSVKQPIDKAILTTDFTAKPYEHTGKLYFANYPLSRAKIQAFINHVSSPMFEYLYLEPLEFPQQKRYVYFKVSALFKESALLKTTSADTDLNPSPPADPS